MKKSILLIGVMLLSVGLKADLFVIANDDFEVLSGSVVFLGNLMNGKQSPTNLFDDSSSEEFIVNPCFNRKVTFKGAGHYRINMKNIGRDYIVFVKKPNATVVFFKEFVHVEYDENVL
ncbi:hypothetical protein KAW80_02360 [Candidatus Babeliales bacterium]|nr:hypothetical protein [Candidatus Babeliales bacterium]